jgi:flagellar basal body-associated protein FliL
MQTTMNTVKQFLLSLSMVIFLVAAGHSQAGAKTPEDRAKALTEKMKTELTLADDQYSKVYDVNLKYAVKNEAIMKSVDSRMSKFKAIRAANIDKTGELKSMLTEDQFKKYREMQKELKEEAKDAYKNKKGA